MYGLPPTPSKRGGEKKGGSNFLIHFLYFLSQYVKIFIPAKAGIFSNKERTYVSKIPALPENEEPKVVIAAGLTSSHPEQRS